MKSAPGKPLEIDMKPIDVDRLLSAFGTAEWGFASLMISGVIDAACDNGLAHPSGSTEINGALAAVTGIGARDETEGMLATQMVATHVAAIRALRRLRSYCEPTRCSLRRCSAIAARHPTAAFAAYRWRLARLPAPGPRCAFMSMPVVRPSSVPSTRRHRGNPRNRRDGARANTYGDTPLRSADPEREPVPIATGTRQTPL